MTQDKRVELDLEEDLDLSEFIPAPRPKGPPKDSVKALSESARFPSREPKSPKPSSMPQRRKRRRTGRVHQFNVKLREDTLNEIFEIADRKDWLLAEVIEHAVKALASDLAGKSEGERT